MGKTERKQYGHRKFIQTEQPMVMSAPGRRVIDAHP